MATTSASGRGDPSQQAITKSTLKTAEPTIVPKPTWLCDTKTPITDVASSGAEPPAAIHVAPATLPLRLIAQMRSSAASSTVQTSRGRGTCRAR